MNPPRSNIAVLAQALRVLARDIKAPDNVPALALREGADMLDDLAAGFDVVAQVVARGGRIGRQSRQWWLFDAGGEALARGVTAIALVLDVAEHLKHPAAAP